MKSPRQRSEKSLLTTKVTNDLDWEDMDISKLELGGVTSEEDDFSRLVSGNPKMNTNESTGSYMKFFSGLRLWSYRPFSTDLPIREAKIKPNKAIRELTFDDNDRLKAKVNYKYKYELVLKSGIVVVLSLCLLIVILIALLIKEKA